MKIKNIFHWSYIEHSLRIIEVCGIVVAVSVILQIPHQVKEWENAQAERCLNVLLHLDAKLKLSKNQQIYNTIKKNKPLLTENNGKFSTEDLDLYLDDITNIVEAEDRQLIKLEDIYNWFEGYFISAHNNKEIRKYLSGIRKDSPDSYEGLEKMVNELIEHKKKLKK